ncbi:MAG: hypothetical protein LBV18_01910, partial [Alistipes sp.]|nr:hypothetical protein [Alistipes sp.]
MKKILNFALLCTAAMTALTMASCDKGDGPNSGAPVITIATQPASVTVTEGEISGSLTVEASATEGATLSYQWYENTTASNAGGTAIEGATGATFALPTDLTVGAYFYFVEVSAEKATAKRSDAATVTVNAEPVATQRYGIVPYVPEPTTRGTRAAAGLENLVFSESDENYNFYFFVLGHINSVPLAYRPAVYYNGTTNITVGYASTNVTENSISNSVTEANENSVTKSSSSTWEDNVSVTAGISGGGLFVTASLEASYGHTWGGSESTDQTSSRSFSNTYETSTASSSEITDEISVTIGENGEPAGMYRWSLFSTTDVYFVLVTNKANTEIISAEKAYCARPTQYWALDYDPEQGGAFGKTAPGEMLEMPDITLADLPEPDECDHQWGEWVTTLMPTDMTEGSEKSTCSVCERVITRAISVLRDGTFYLSDGSSSFDSGYDRVSYANNTLTVKDQAKIVISGHENIHYDRKIVVDGNAIITLRNVDIATTCPISIKPGVRLTIRLEGKNVLKASQENPGIRTTGAELVITGGPGSLIATGGQSTNWTENGSGAGIGGN